MNSYCNNCGKHGHQFHQCKSPITSHGIIAFRENPLKNNIREYLLIRRKDTLGYIDFMRGKYSIYNKKYILNMIKQMTNDEKARLITQPFSKLWTDLWGSLTTDDKSVKGTSGSDSQCTKRNKHDAKSLSIKGPDHFSVTDRKTNVLPEEPMHYKPDVPSQNLNEIYNMEETNSRNKFESLKSGIYTKTDFYDLEELINMTEPEWKEPEWGFPKGRRNYQEKDYECAIREFCEETGYTSDKLIPLKNIQPFEEIFTGSNYKSYKHKYYVNYMKYEDTLTSHNLQECEVSKSLWASLERCYELIRYYNVEKKRLLESVENMLSENYLSQSQSC
jgi:ADP-ribose pyrophosphatase YjhB (NUDIX family)